MLVSRRGSIANAALVALLFVGGVVIALAFQRESPAAAGTSIDTERADITAPRATDILGTDAVKNVAGETIALITPGEPAIIMISSVTCSWCKRTLRDLRELSQGRALSRLKLLTLEGASGGTAMVTRETLNGVQLIGPVNDNSQSAITFRFQGTPTFLAVNRHGRVVQTLPGYPSRDVLKLWYNVMVGDADVP